MEIKKLEINQQEAEKIKKTVEAGSRFRIEIRLVDTVLDMAVDGTAYVPIEEMVRSLAESGELNAAHQIVYSIAEKLFDACYRKYVMGAGEVIKAKHGGSPEEFLTNLKEKAYSMRDEMSDEDKRILHNAFRALQNSIILAADNSENDPNKKPN